MCALSCMSAAELALTDAGVQIPGEADSALLTALLAALVRDCVAVMRAAKLDAAYDRAPADRAFTMAATALARIPRAALKPRPAKIQRKTFRRNLLAYYTTHANTMTGRCVANMLRGITLGDDRFTSDDALAAATAQLTERPAAFREVEACMLVSTLARCGFHPTRRTLARACDMVRPAPRSPLLPAGCQCFCALLAVW